MFRLDLATLDVDAWNKTRAGAEDMLASFAGEDALDALSQAASKATYQRTVDLVTIMTNGDSVRATAEQRLLDQIASDTRVVHTWVVGGSSPERPVRRSCRFTCGDGDRDAAT